MYSWISPTPKLKPGQKEIPPQEVANSVSVLPFFIVYVLYPLAYFDFYGYLPFSPLFGPWFIFLIIPLLDTLIGLDGFNPANAKVYSMLDKRWVFKLPTMLWLPSNLLFLYWGMYHALPQTWSDATTHRWWGLVFNFGIAAGIAINFGHELIHKTTWYEHWSGCFNLSLICSYGWFAVEHTDGHHKLVSTPEDPASSRLNENVYAFLPRSIIGGMISGFNLNFRKCAALTLSTVVFSLTFVPRYAISFYYLQAFIGVIYLEVINYVEHYGLQRNKDPKTGIYEPVNPLHSWNYGSRFQNSFLINLMRHSDHHAVGGRRYQALRSYPFSPNLPFGYATAIMLALVPPAWKKIMNPRVAHASEIQEKLRKKGMLETVFTDKWLSEHNFFDDFKEAGWY